MGLDQQNNILTNFAINHKLIIFQGHDMVGKTNIANALSKVINIPLFKFTKQHDKNPNFLSILRYTAECQIQICEQTNYPIIFDRFVGSQYAYSKFNNRKTDIQKIFDLDYRASKLNGVIIYCYKDKEFYKDDDLQLYTINDYDLLKKYYDQFLQKSKCRIIKLCTNNEDLQFQIKYLCKELKVENNII